MYDSRATLEQATKETAESTSLQVFQIRLGKPFADLRLIVFLRAQM